MREKKKTSIDCSAIIGTPFERGGSTPRVGMDCWGVVRWCAQQEGLELPALEDGDALEVVGAKVRGWKQIGKTAIDATRLLDVVATATERSGIHVSACVDERLGLFATTHEDGSVVLAPRWSLRNVLGVYRHVSR